MVIRNRNKNKFNKLNKGFTLIELVVAIASGSIILVGLTSMIVFISLSYKNITTRSNSLRACDSLKEILYDELESYEINEYDDIELIYIIIFIDFIRF